MIYTFDPKAITEFIDLVIEPGQVFELRSPKCKLHNEWKTGTLSGYFDRDHVDELLAAIGRIEQAAGVYITPNPVKPELHSRAYNRARIVNGEPTTGEDGILRRRWLLIDVDTKRPAGISATAAEKFHGAEMLTNVDYWLWEHGFPPGLLCDSGNGSHAMIPIDLPANDGGFCHRILKTLAREFDNEHAAIDTTTANASRIWKLAGTLSCKGDHCPDLGRPWRMARIVTNCMEACEWNA